MTKIVTDAGGGEIPCHEDVDVALCRKTVEQCFGDLNPDNYLAGSVLVIREKRNSGCAKKTDCRLTVCLF